MLSQYSRLVSAVREASRRGELSEVGLKHLFQRCIDEGILPDFLMEHGREAVNMLFEELTQEEVNEIYKRNGLAEGRAQGLAEGRAQGLALFSKLLELKRYEDAERAATDEEYQEKLFEEFGLE